MYVCEGVQNGELHCYVLLLALVTCIVAFVAYTVAPKLMYQMPENKFVIHVIIQFHQIYKVDFENLDEDFKISILFYRCLELCM